MWTVSNRTVNDGASGSTSPNKVWLVGRILLNRRIVGRYEAQEPCCTTVRQRIFVDQVGNPPSFAFDLYLFLLLCRGAFVVLVNTLPQFANSPRYPQLKRMAENASTASIRALPPYLADACRALQDINTAANVAWDGAVGNRWHIRRICRSIQRECLMARIQRESLLPCEFRLVKASTLAVFGRFATVYAV